MMIKLISYFVFLIYLLLKQSQCFSHPPDNTTQILTTVSALEPKIDGSIFSERNNVEKIDVIFPAPHENHDSSLSTKHPQLDKSISADVDSRQHNGAKSSSQHSELERRQIDLRNLFQWKQLDTNKCSKPCGLGYKILQWFCQDIKFQVRVEDSLCELGAGLPKPTNVSTTDKCSEFPCPIQWHTGDWSNANDCGRHNTEVACQVIIGDDQTEDYSIQVTPASSRQANQTRKVFCAYVDAAGNTIELFEGACDGLERPTNVRPCPVQPARACPSEALSMPSRATIAGRSVVSLSSSSSSSETPNDELPGMDDSSNLGHREHRASNKSSRRDHYPTSESTNNRREVELPFDDDNIISMIPQSSSATLFDLFSLSTSVRPSTQSTRRPDGLAVNSNSDNPNDDISSNTHGSQNNEPYYAVGSWSACDAPCGVVSGTRRRDVTCKMMLQASGIAVDLPDYTCNGVVKPTTREACESDPCNLPEAGKSKKQQVVSTSDETGSLTVKYDIDNIGSRSFTKSVAMATNYLPKDEVSKNTTNTDSNDNDDDDDTDNDTLSTSLLFRAPTLSNSSQSLNTNNDRFVWRDDGWTQCSAECLGGLQENILVCVDNVTQSIVDSSLCPLTLKPDTFTQTCNDHPCNPQWQTGQWTQCSHDCGALGVTTRHVTCVQEISRGRDNIITLSNDLCLATGSSMPDTQRPCNRIDCKPAWSVGSWSECQLHHHSLSSDLAPQCGFGTRTRNITCRREFAAQPTTLDETWHPGKLSHVPFEVCFNEYRTAPTLDLNCHIKCPDIAPIQNSGDESTVRHAHIDAMPYQNYTMPRGTKNANLKIGGQAQLLRGSSVKIVCKTLQTNRRNDQSPTDSDQAHIDSLYGSISNVVDDFHFPDWRLNGTKIFVGGSMRAQKNRLRTLGGRTDSSTAADNGLSDIYFSPARTGRFRLSPKGSLKIKNLQYDDSGVYTCTIGRETEKIIIDVPRTRKSFVPTVDNLMEG